MDGIKSGIRVGKNPEVLFKKIFARHNIYFFVMIVIFYVGISMNFLANSISKTARLE